MRERLYEILDVQDDSSVFSRIYNVLNIVMIVISIIPLMFYGDTELFIYMDRVAVIFFIVEYILRLSTADFKLHYKESSWAFLTYPFTPFAVIDLLSILPSLSFFSSSWRLLRLLRLTRSLRVFRTFKLFRYSKSMVLLQRAVKNQKDSLVLVFSLASAYTIISSLLIFNAEGGTFPTFFEALEWSVASLTTVSYGGYEPVTVIGRIIAMMSYLVGVLVIALPTSILTAGYSEELNKDREIGEDGMGQEDKRDN